MSIIKLNHALCYRCGAALMPVRSEHLHGTDAEVFLSQVSKLAWNVMSVSAPAAAKRRHQQEKRKPNTDGLRWERIRN
jgi:hypothetical protein